jgi:TolB protein
MKNPEGQNRPLYIISAVVGALMVLVGCAMLIFDNVTLPAPGNTGSLSTEVVEAEPTRVGEAPQSEPGSGLPAQPAETNVAIFMPTRTAVPVRATAIPTQTLPPLPTHTSTNTPLPTPTATPLFEKKLIAFYSARTGANEIFVMNSDGTGVKQLTFDSQDSRAPTWSPDGTQIVYQSIKHGDYEIFIVDLNGNVKQVTNNGCNDYAPAWSPDGKYFAYYSDCDGNRDIYTMQIDGTHVRQLTITDVAYNWFPLWSPDGTEITYSSNLSGNYTVMVIPAGGGTARKLQRGCISAFFPNGKQIAFTSYCTDYGNIMVMNADGSDVRTIYSKDNATNPHPTSDGKWIVFQAINSDNDDIWIMGVDGSNLTRLTTDPAKDANPVWQP